MENTLLCVQLPSHTTTIHDQDSEFRIQAGYYVYIPKHCLAKRVSIRQFPLAFAATKHVVHTQCKQAFLVRFASRSAHTKHLLKLHTMFCSERTPIPTFMNMYNC